MDRAERISEVSRSVRERAAAADRADRRTTRNLGIGGRKASGRLGEVCRYEVKRKVRREEAAVSLVEAEPQRRKGRNDSVVKYVRRSA